jgi:hypothetical protein
MREARASAKDGISVRNMACKRKLRKDEEKLEEEAFRDSEGVSSIGLCTFSDCGRYNLKSARPGVNYKYAE